MTLLVILKCIAVVSASFTFIAVGISLLINSIDSHNDRKYR